MTEDEVKEVKAEIERVQVKIETVESEIKTVEVEIKATIDKEEKKQLREKEKQLREKEKQLREEKNKLREEKNKLLDKDQLREEKTKLLEKEAAEGPPPFFPTHHTYVTIPPLPPPDLTSSHGSRIPFHSIVADENAARLWQTLLAGTVKQESIDGVSIAVLPDGIEWLTEPRSELFIRSSTENVFTIVRRRLNGTKANGVVITGNPGIGKSWTLCYFLMKLAKEKRTVVFESADADRTWVFRSDGTTSTIRHPRSQVFDPVELDDPQSVYLFDTAGSNPREPLRVNAFTVVASSPNPANYKQFIKRVLSRLYLPCWTLDDLMKVRAYFPHITKEILEERFRKFGGIPRFVLSPSDEGAGTVEALLEEAISTTSLQAILESGTSMESFPK